jgi:hypothetical protein
MPQLPCNLLVTVVAAIKVSASRAHRLLWKLTGSYKIMKEEKIPLWLKNCNAKGVAWMPFTFYFLPFSCQLTPEEDRAA